MTKQQLFPIESEKDYQNAMQHFEVIKDAKRNSAEHKEKLLLAFLINQYEEKLWSLPVLDPGELMKIRVEDFGYKYQLN